ncbi:hypothetical protein B296_00023768 [Ensete ventricosum]|uniref:Clp R domain-containing protein n=1 Tax=Ensete ventricosum TaxID=4639 RepID=A0A427AQR5_ENSVE|nr:hypothetical protein B296_00023768 [Ensete ventricosum]
MADSLVHSAILPSAVMTRSQSQLRGSGKSKRGVKMVRSMRMHPLRLQTFAGLRAADNLDFSSRCRQDFYSVVSRYISNPQGKATRGVPKAMFERFTEKAIKVIMLAQEEARRLGHNFVGTEQILLGLIGEGTGIAAKVLKSMGINLKDARVEVEKIIGRGSGFVAVEIPFTPRAKRVLELSLEEARQLGTPLRPSSIERTKNNPCLIGEPGVGKTAIAEGLAQRIANGDVPETIEGKKVITLDMGLLVAGTKYRGEFEERLKKLMEEIKQSDEIILFIDEVHTLIGAGAAEGAIDAANILKPALARGELQVFSL